MTLAELKDSLRQSEPPTSLSPALRALWWAANDDWDKAHKIVMDEGGKASAWVHAHLHRVEGDLDNAGYWYRQAQRPTADGPLNAEWDTIVQTLLTADAR